LEYFQRTLDFHPDHRLEFIRYRKGGIEVHFESRKKMHKKTFDRILIAAGRHPNLSSLNLQNAGIKVKQYQSVDCNPGTLQVKGGAVFLAGDVSRIRPVLHEAGDEGVIAGYNAAHYPKIRRFKRKTPMSIAFTQPQIAVAGQTWGRLNPEVCSGEADYTDQGRSRIAGVNTGLMRLYADRKSKRILGAELFGPDAEHIAHLLTWCIQKRFTADQMLEFPYYHPTVEESIRTALKNLQFT
ncbi:MAG: dihydrolipoyl dehydrogenase, partial [Candidatus Omnitrophica bacterium]|nr:dihydrolipoyl dehydrogenase [Candidatus Omnitrophota bacterium]